MARVVRVLIYEGPEAALSKQIAQSQIPVLGGRIFGQVSIRSGIVQWDLPGSMYSGDRPFEEPEPDYTMKEAREKADAGN